MAGRIALADCSEIGPRRDPDLHVACNEIVEELTQQHRWYVFTAEPLGKNVGERIFETRLIQYARVGKTAEASFFTRQGGSALADGLPQGSWLGNWATISFMRISGMASQG